MQKTMSTEEINATAHKKHEQTAGLIFLIAQFFFSQLNPDLKFILSFHRFHKGIQTIAQAEDILK